jgi:hypothetical protein
MPNRYVMPIVDATEDLLFGLTQGKVPPQGPPDNMHYYVYGPDQPGEVIEQKDLEAFANRPGSFYFISMTLVSDGGASEEDVVPEF